MLAKTPGGGNLYSVARNGKEFSHCGNQYEVPQKKLKLDHITKLTTSENMPEELYINITQM